MSKQRFFSWPAGWGKALPWGILAGLVVVAGLVIVDGSGSQGNGLDRLFCVDAAFVFAFVVVGFTAIAARHWADPQAEDKPKP